MTDTGVIRARNKIWFCWNIPYLKLQRFLLLSKGYKWTCWRFRSCFHFHIHIRRNHHHIYFGGKKQRLYKKIQKPPLLTPQLSMPQYSILKKNNIDGNNESWKTMYNTSLDIEPTFTTLTTFYFLVRYRYCFNVSCETAYNTITTTATFYASSASPFYYSGRYVNVHAIYFTPNSTIESETTVTTTSISYFWYNKIYSHK